MAVERADGGWTATLDSEITTSGGTLDELQFGLPESWSGPFSIEPSIPSEVIDLPNDGRVLVLHPPAPMGGTTRLHSRSAQDRRRPASSCSRGSPGRRLEVAVTILVLPTQYNLQQLAWDTRGLVEEPLPEIFEPSTVRSGLKTYSSATPRATAELKSIEKLAENAQVRFADLAWRGTLTAPAMEPASFDLEPAGSRNLLARPSATFRVDSLGDRWYAAIATGHRKSTLASFARHVHRLPLRIDVVYRGRLPDNPRDVPHEALAPWLVGLPVEQTLWTISGPRLGRAANDRCSSIGCPPPERKSHDSNPPQRLPRRLHQQLSSNRPMTSSDGTVLGSIAGSRLATPPSGLPHFPFHSCDASNVTEQVTHEEGKQMRLARQIAAWPAIEPVWNEPATPDGPLRSWQRSLGRSHGNAHSVLAGGAFAPPLEFPRAYAGDWATRVGQAAIACVVVLLIGWAIRATTLPDAFARWPQAAVIAVGLFWWLWLSPSAVGWIIVALGQPLARGLTGHLAPW